MSSTPGPNDFQWEEVAPDQEQMAHRARQVRIMLAAGKGVEKIKAWLQQSGMSPDAADRYVAELVKPSDGWERFCGRAGLVLIVVLTLAILVLVAIRRPWDGKQWMWTTGGMEIDPATGFVMFCILYAVGMCAVWFGANMLGGLLDRIRDRNG